MLRIRLLAANICCLLLALPLLGQDQKPEQPKADRTLLVVFAHPNDEFLVSPLLARYAREGADIRLVIVTRGEKGRP